ncbi:hypothetical protein D3C72_507860 [compost metagenome]
MRSDAPSWYGRARAACLCVAAPLGVLLVGLAAPFVLMLPHQASWLLPLLVPAGVYLGYGALGRHRDGLLQVVRSYFYVFGALVALFLLFRPQTDRGTALAAIGGVLGGLAVGVAQAAWNVYHTGEVRSGKGLLDDIVP